MGYARPQLVVAEPIGIYEVEREQRGGGLVRIEGEAEIVATEDSEVDVAPGRVVAPSPRPEQHEGGKAMTAGEALQLLHHLRAYASPVHS